MKAISFEYPTLQQLEVIKNASSLEDVRKYLGTISSPLGSKFSLETYYRKDRTHIVARCRACPSKLIWRKKEEKYEIEKINNFHNHPKQSSIKFKKTSLISQFIETLPPGLQKKAIVELTSSKLNVSEASINFVLKKQLEEVEKNLEEVIGKYASDWTFLTNPEFENSSASLPKLLILSNNKMRDLYQKYRRTMSFDLTYSTINEKSENIKDQYLVGFFAGVNQFYKTVIFSAVVMKGISKRDFKQLLSSFFQLQGNKYPETICTDQQIAFIEAIKQLKSEGLMETDYTLDRWHLLRSAKQNRSRLQKINQLLNSKTDFQYRAKYNELISQMSFEQAIELQQKIHDKRNKSCLAFVQKFVGLNISDSRNENLHNRLKTDLPNRKPYHLVIKILMSFSNKINEKANVYNIETTNLQDYLLTPSLRSLRVRVSKHVYQFFMKEWAESQLYSSEKMETGCHRVFSCEEEEFFVKLNGSKWRCECNLIAKTGVSCSHEIKVLTIEGISLINGIDSYWLFEQKVTRQIIEQISKKEKKKELLKSKKTKRAS